MYIILYFPGAAGDLVSSMIDPTDYFLDSEAKKISCKYGSWRKNRIQQIGLAYHNKKSIIEKWEAEKEFFKSCPNYKAISSHDFAYYIDYDTSDKDFIIIDSTGLEHWTMNRIYNLNNRFENISDRNFFAKPSEDDIMQQRYIFDLFLSLYKTDKIIKLEDILNGKLIQILRQWIDTPLNTEWYEQWLSWHGKSIAQN